MKARQVPLLFRLIYFVLIGLWAGGICAAIGWMLCLSILGLPVGIWVLHRLPLVTTLTMPDDDYAPIETPGAWSPARPVREGTSFFVRALWFLLVGWWLSALWIKVAFLASATIVLMPIGFWMINRVPAVLTLEGV